MPISRLKVRMVKCPECGAKPGNKCKGKFRITYGRTINREANHQSRIDLYKIIFRE